MLKLNNGQPRHSTAAINLPKHQPDIRIFERKKGLEIGFSLEDDLTRRYELLWAKLHIYRPVFT